jgi:hypothetical protein
MYITDNDLRLNEAHLRDLHREREQRRLADGSTPVSAASTSILHASRRRLGIAIVHLGERVGGPATDHVPAASS